MKFFSYLFIISSFFIGCLLSSCSNKSAFNVDAEGFVFTKNLTDSTLKNEEFYAIKNENKSGVITFIVIDNLRNQSQAATRADQVFEDIHNLFNSSNNYVPFKEVGLLIYVTPQNSLIQVRAGSEYNSLLRSHGVIAGSSYIQLQEKTIKLGVDSMIPEITRHMWGEIDEIQHMSVLKKIYSKITIEWVENALFSLGTPSDFFSGKLPKFITSIISALTKKTNNLLLTIIFCFIIYWLASFMLDYILMKFTKHKDRHVLIGQDSIGVYLLKLILSSMIVIPSFGVFTYFSNSRLEDILLMESNNIPYIVFDWDNLSSAAHPSLLLVTMMSVVFFLSYCLTPRHLHANYHLNRSWKGALYGNNYFDNKTNLSQYIRIYTKGTWNFIFFLGCVGLAIIGQIIVWIKFLASLVIGFLGYVFHSIDFHSSFDSSSIVDSSEISTDSLSDELQIDSAKEGYITIKNFSAMSKMSMAKSPSLSYEQNNSDEDGNIGKNIAGLAISETIAFQLPSNFFSNPSRFALQRVFCEAAIVSVILFFLIPLVFNEALTIIFTIFYLCKFIISLADELIYYAIENYKENEKLRKEVRQSIIAYRLADKEVREYLEERKRKEND